MMTNPTTSVRVCGICDIADCEAHRQAPNVGAVKVKPLVWLRHHRIEWMWQVQGCPYDIRCEGGIGYLVDYDSETLIGERGGPHNTLDDAKAAAQSDHSARIMAAVEITPDPRDEVIARLETERDEAIRRRDGWKAKAEGFDAVRLALREKVGTPWPPSLSRALWAGIAADEKNRADAAEDVIAQLVDSAYAIEMWDAARGYPIPYRHRDPLRAALAAAKEVMK